MEDDMSRKTIQVRQQPHTKCSQCPIREMALFQGVPRNQLDGIQKYREHQFVVPAKTQLYLEGSKPGYVYTLFDGLMAVNKSFQSGRRQILRFVMPGDFLGFQVDDNGVISHSVLAISESIVCGFPRSSLKEMFEGQPRLALRLASMKSRDMALCQHHQTFGSRKDSHESIAFLLLELFHRTRQQMSHNYDAGKNTIVFPLTQEDIGDAVGLTNVHVNRVLRQFANEGLIECRHRKLRIIDEDKLSEISEFNVGMIAVNSLI